MKCDEGGALVMGLVFLQDKEETPELALSLFVCVSVSLSPLCKHTARKQLSASREDSPHEETDLLAPGSWLLSPPEL